MRISGALRRVTLARPRGSGPSSRKPRNLVNIALRRGFDDDAYTQQRPNKLVKLPATVFMKETPVCGRCRLGCAI